MVPLNNMRKPGKEAELVEGRVRWGGIEFSLDRVKSKMLKRHPRGTIGVN